MKNRASVMRIVCLVLFAGVTLACATVMGRPARPTPTAESPTATPHSRRTPTPAPTLDAAPSVTPRDYTPVPAPPSPIVVDAEMQARHRRIFEEIWGAVSEDYLYSDYNGLDWDAVKAEYTPQVEAAPDDETFWQLMQALIDSLGDNHSSFLSPEEAAEEDRAASGDLDYVGVGVYVTVPDDKEYGVVLFPLPGSPAEVAGVLAHDRVWTIAGAPACCNPDGSDNLDLLRGEESSFVEVTLQSPGQDVRTLSLQRERIQTQVPVLWRRISTEAGDVGYLFIPTLWDETIAERTREILETQMAAGALSGLILDMRINGGGAYRELKDLLALFVEGDVGYFYSRDEAQDTLHIAADPIQNSMDLPLVILVGRDTESFAEVFSGVLQAAGRAILVGHPTAGNVETLFPYNFEDGSRLWLAEESFAPPAGTRWEGQGVQPDETVSAKWEDFTDATDPYIAVALRVLQAETRD